MAGRTLLDIVSGGRVKHTGVGKYKGLPGAAPTVPVLFSKLYESMAEYQEREMSKSAGYGMTQGDLYEIAMGVAGVAPIGRAIKTASTSSKLLSGWINNLYRYMATLSKKELKKMNTADNIVRDAMVSVQKYQDDVQGTWSKLSSINKDLGLNKKVTVPAIKGAAGGKIKQAAKPKGSQIKEDVPGTKWRKEGEFKAKTAKKKEQTTGYEPYHRGTQKLDR